jgi:hypothetical protein
LAGNKHRPEGEGIVPIPKKWSLFNRENLSKVPEERGAYEIANKDKRIIDVGGSDGKGGVHSRLTSRLREGKPPTAKYFRYEEVGIFDSGIDSEASHSKKYQQKHGRKPRYTQRSPKKKSFLGL